METKDSNKPSSKSYSNGQVCLHDCDAWGNVTKVVICPLNVLLKYSDGTQLLMVGIC